MKSFLPLVPVLALVATAVAGPAGAIDPALPDYRPTRAVAGSVAIVFGDPMENVVKAWNEAFQKFHPGAKLTESLRPINPEDRGALGPHTDEVFQQNNQAYEDAYGYEPFRIQVSMAAFNLKEHIQAVGVFVSKENPIGEVSLAQLDAMYSSTRRRGYPADINTWGQLGLTGEWADKPIHLYGRGVKKDDIGSLFRDVVLLGGVYKSAFRSPLPGRTVSAEVVKAVTADPCGIGFFGFSFPSPGLKPLALSDARGVVAQPTLGDVASGRYPLDRPLFLYINRKPGEPLDPLIKEFLTYVLSRQGQEAVIGATYLPLPAEIVATELAKLD